MTIKPRSHEQLDMLMRPCSVESWPVSDTLRISVATGVPVGQKTPVTTVRIKNTVTDECSAILSRTTWTGFGRRDLHDCHSQAIEEVEGNEEEYVCRYQKTN